MLDQLRRHNLRYLMFRIKTETTGGNPLPKSEVLSLLTGWGYAVKTQKAAGAVLDEIKAHYESQSAFGEWENFCGDYGRAASWDIGLFDPAAPDAINVATMITRPEKWFLFGINSSQAINIRRYPQSVQTGLDFFSKHNKGLVLSRNKLKERQKKLGLRGDPRRRDRLHYENDQREYDYEAILEHARENGIQEWPYKPPPRPISLKKITTKTKTATAVNKATKKTAARKKRTKH